MRRLVINSLLVMTQDGMQCFYEEFSQKLNIVYGRNTSGKSTLFNSILYVFGINEVKTKMLDLLEYDLVFRLDFLLSGLECDQRCTIIRDGDFVYIKVGNGKYKRFSGIGADQSAEHIKLKEYLNELFGCTLKLDSKGQLKTAPLEAIFLPYFVSQDVGWVYLRKSFSSLEFYRNFKEDYLDYYLGVENCVDREKKLELETELGKLRAKIAMLIELEANDSDIQIAILNDEMHPPELPEYISKYEEENDDIAKLEKELIIRSNENSYLRERKNILARVQKNHLNIYEGQICPTCTQEMPINIEISYQLKQDENDTKQQLIEIKEKIKAKQSKINQIKSRIKLLRKSSTQRFVTLEKRANIARGIQGWIDMKTNIHLNQKVKSQVGTLEIRRIKVESILKNMRSSSDVQGIRNAKIKRFRDIYLQCITDLKVKPATDTRFTDIYSISAFPSQGVELHKTIMAYHFAFNRIMRESPNIHRFPFILDAIFKEDVDAFSKSIILDFISKWAPNDTQTIMSIAESDTSGKTIKEYNKKHFNNSAHLICIGEVLRERSFLEERRGKYQDVVNETILVLDSL